MDSNKVHELVQHMSETEDDGQHLIPKIVVCLNVVFRPTIGALAAIRGAYDGRLSILALFLSIVYFALFGIVVYMDHRFERMERWARLLPKVCGLGIAGVQLHGVLPRYSCGQSWQSCL